jgi:hypothetical protein
MTWAGMVALIASAALTSLGPRGHAQTPTFARLRPGSFTEVEILDFQRSSWRMVYRLPTGWLTALSVGPDGSRMALLAWTEGTAAGHDYVVPPASRLIVIDMAGHMIAPPVARVQRYAWCGAGCIVYITGEDEESHYDFRPEGMGKLDIATGKASALPSPPTPIGITWASFDSAAYIKNLPRPGEGFIYRLDLVALTLEPTSFKDHVFSPTGRYYIYEGEFTDTLVIYDRRTNEPVDLESFRREALIIGWASPREDILLAVRRPPPRPRPVGRPRPTVKKAGEDEKEVLYKLYDLSTRRVGRSMTGYLGRWVGSPYTYLLGGSGGYQVAEIR